MQAPARFAGSAIAHSRSMGTSVERSWRARSGITGSSVFSVKSWLRARTTKTKPSG
ncbi:MAG TPA: hypothetical protein VFD84_14825 [Candidatus Binatia bacterium]|nr:hypothetical protein [Candidatus Binatia bacterium]